LNFHRSSNVYDRPNNRQPRGVRVVGHETACFGDAGDGGIVLALEGNERADEGHASRSRRFDD